MRLTVYTDFSLRVLMHVALHPERLSTIGEIATSYGISKNHLMKVVYELGAAGYLMTVRGKNGGIRLARPPAGIGLGDVVRQCEPDMALVPCFDGVNALCAITPACKLRSALCEARSAFLNVLDTYTLADLVENKAALRGLIAAGAAAATHSVTTAPGASRAKRFV